MKFTAGEHWLAIDYKLPHEKRIYNAAPFVVEATKGKKRSATTYAFDTEMIAPGGSWDLPAQATFIHERVLRGADTPPGDTPE